MGSACNNSVSNNYFEKLTPDTGIVYTGPTITALGICTGDRLNEVEAVLLQKILDYATGVGISIPSIDLTTCTAFTSCITCCNNGCTDLPCLLECYKTAICTIWGDVQTLQSQVSALLDGPYNTGCLTGLPTNPTLNQIIQQLILQFCTLQTQVATLTTQVTNLTTGLPVQIGNFLLNALTTCQGTTTLVKTGPGASAQIAFKGFVPIGAIMPYAGPTANKFDPTGLGLANTDVCGFALCNGNNGTVDMREQVPVGCGAGVMGGSTLPSNASGANYALGVLVGQASVTLLSNQSGFPGSAITIVDNGHDHVLYFNQRNGNFTTNGSNGYMDATSVPGSNTGGTAPFVPANNVVSGSTIQAKISKSYSNISISATATNAQQSHENRQPSRALLYIQRIA